MRNSSRDGALEEGGVYRSERKNGRILASMRKGKKRALEDHADKIREELNVPRQNEPFKAAIDARNVTAWLDARPGARRRAFSTSKTSTSPAA